MLQSPEQTLEGPEIEPGADGAVFTVIDLDLQLLLPHALTAFTRRVPLLVGVKETLVPEPLGVPPPVYSHWYEVVPLTGEIL